MRGASPHVSETAPPPSARLSGGAYLASKSSMQTRRVTVLVVEDAGDTRELFAVALEDAGYRVVCATSVQEALALLRAGLSIDAVIADYSLGDGTGAELLHQASNEGHLDLKETPALICTAYRYVELPPDVGILHKPVGPYELLRAVGDAVGPAM